MRFIPILTIIISTTTLGGETVTAWPSEAVLYREEEGFFDQPAPDANPSAGIHQSPISTPPAQNPPPAWPSEAVLYREEEGVFDQPAPDANPSAGIHQSPISTPPPQKKNLRRGRARRCSTGRRKG